MNKGSSGPQKGKRPFSGNNQGKQEGDRRGRGAGPFKGKPKWSKENDEKRPFKSGTSGNRKKFVVDEAGDERQSEEKGRGEGFDRSKRKAGFTGPRTERKQDSRPFRDRDARGFEKKRFDKKPFGSSTPGDRKKFPGSETSSEKRNEERSERRDFGSGDRKSGFSGNQKERKPDSRPFRDRNSTGFEKKGFEKKGFEKKPFNKKDEKNKPEDAGKSFSDVVKSAFHERAKTTDAEREHMKRQQFEDKVYGELDEVKETVKKPYERQQKKAALAAKPIKEDGRKKKFRKDEEEEGDGEVKEMTLNKFIAHSGECSRRDAAEFVKQGKVKVNGELITDPGYRVKKGDAITMAGKKLTPAKNFTYVLLNKPKGYITTNDDPQGRRTVMELVTGVGPDRIFPVGRLDRDTTGLLLMTNDGDLTQRLCHPSFDIKKVYHVTLDKPLTKADFEKIMNGLELEDGKITVDEMAYLENKSELGLEIHSGKNRIVRRIFESLGYVVEKLDRMMYAGLTKKNLPRGKWRKLTEHEVVLLKHFKS